MIKLQKFPIQALAYFMHILFYIFTYLIYRSIIMDKIRLFSAEVDAALSHNAFRGDVFDAVSKQVESLCDDLDLDDDLVELEL